MARKRKSRRARVSERLRDSGPDASGNFDVNPYAARGHVVEVAPKELRANPDSSRFPKRIVTQRVIDRYRAHGHITDAEWKAAETLLQFWNDKEMQAKTTSGYDPVMVQTSADPSSKLAKWMDGALGYLRLIRAVPYHCQGVVKAVVIDDQTAADWARSRGFGDRDSKGHGLDRLRSGLQALAAHLGH